MKKYINLIIFLLTFVQYNYAQNLCKYKSFFKQEKHEYAEWLNSTHISDIAYLEDMKVSKEKVTLYLRSNYSTDDSLKAAWTSLEKKYTEQYNMRIGDKMFSTFIFLFDLKPEQAEIIISGNQFSNSKIRIYQGNEGVKADDDFPNVMAGGILEISLQNLTFTKTTDGCNLESNIDITQVRRQIGSFLQDYYKDKGTLFYTARIDTTRSYLNNLDYRITCLKDEIIDDNVYEFIKVEVSIFASRDKLNVVYDITGKYASGLICSETKQKFYSTMETKYSGALNDYAKDIGAKIENHLRELSKN